MSSLRRTGPAAAAWVGVALLLALGAIAVSRVPAPWWHALDWEGARAAFEPWRVFTAAWVHWSPRHLALNLGGAFALAVLGWAAALPRAAAYAWLLAWPLGQVLMLLVPVPAHLGGLSGTLHAGAAVAAVWLVLARQGAPRATGGLLAVALAGKLAWEWVAGPQPIAGTDAVTWPLNHLTGCLGAVLAAAPMAWQARAAR